MTEGKPTFPRDVWEHAYVLIIVMHAHHVFNFWNHVI